jgi:hypothetical protein
VSAKNAKLNVIAIDPGERVGWSTAEYQPDSPELGPDRTGLFLVNHGISQLKPFALKLAESIHKYDVVIYEKYVLFGGERGLAQIGGEIPTAQLVGMIRLLAWQHDKKLVSQAPKIKATADKVAKGVFKELIEGESKTHDDAHDIDAIRHLVYWHWKKEVTDGVKA